MGPTERYDSDLFRHEANYQPLCSYQALERKTYLGSPARPKKCRFCKRSEPVAKFTTIAHVIPISIGNKHLLSNYECDECNDAFGATFETDFATYFQPYRTLARLRGRKNFPAMKSDVDEWRIEGHDGGLDITHLSTKPLVAHIPEEKRFIFSVPRGPYTPQEVYKCFIRMGLTAMPEQEIGFFEEHFAWASCIPTGTVCIKPTFVWETFFNGPQTFRSTGIFLWRRISDERRIPYMVCLIYFANSMFQFFIPSKEKDKNWMGETTNFIFIPPHPVAAKGGTTIERLDIQYRALQK